MPGFAWYVKSVQIDRKDTNGTLSDKEFSVVFALVRKEKAFAMARGIGIGPVEATDAAAGDGKPPSYSGIKWMKWQDPKLSLCISYLESLVYGFSLLLALEIESSTRFRQETKVQIYFKATMHIPPSFQSEYHRGFLYQYICIHEAEQ